MSNLHYHGSTTTKKEIINLAFRLCPLKDFLEIFPPPPNIWQEKRALSYLGCHHRETKNLGNEKKWDAIKLIKKHDFKKHRQHFACR